MGLMVFTGTVSAGLSVYPPVPGLDPSPHYQFRVRQVGEGEWLEPFAWFTQCIESTPANDETKYYSQFIGGWSHTYCNFEIGEGVPVEVEITRLDPETGEPMDIQGATPHPRRKVRSWRVEDGKAYVIIDQPALFAVDIDGQMDENKAPRAALSGPDEVVFPFLNENAIHTVSVFANPFITDKPDPNDPSVYLVEPGEIPPETGDWTTLYFKPGVHTLFEGDRLDAYYEGFDFQLQSDKSYYIPGDAIVYGHMNTFDKANSSWPGLSENIRVFGHGTISGAKSSHPEDIDEDMSHISTDAGKRFRSLEIFGTGSVVEGITFADSANHTMKMNTRGHADLEEKPANYARWLKVFTWRANGDGITMLGNGYLEDSFIRAQDDGSYVRGLGIRRVVYWNDVNGTALRNTFIMSDRGDNFPESLPQTLYVEDIDILYGRGVFHTDNSRYSVIQKQSFRQQDGNTGDHVVFRNINYSDPMPARKLFGFDTRVDRGFPVGNPTGIRFENIRAAAPSVFGRPNTFWGGLTDDHQQEDPDAPDIQMTGFIFDNVVIGGRQINSMADFVTDENVSDFIFENTEPQTRTFLNISGYGKWYVWADWTEGVEPANHDIVNHTSVADVLIVDAPAYAGTLNVSHADEAIVQVEKATTLTVTDSLSLGSEGEPGQIRLIDGTLEILNDDDAALSVTEGHIHFDEGTLSWAGNQIDRVQELYDAGAFSFGSGRFGDHSETASVIAVEDLLTLYAEFDVASGYTTIWLAEDDVLAVNILPRDVAGAFDHLTFDGTDLLVNGTSRPENVTQHENYYEVTVVTDDDTSVNSSSVNKWVPDLIPGQMYRLAFNARGSTTGTVFVVVRNGSFDNQLRESFEVSPDWQSYEFTFFMDELPDNRAQIRFLVGGNGDGFTFGFDEISLSLADTHLAHNNFLNNGDFQGVGDDWEIGQNPNLNAEANGGIQTRSEPAYELIALSGLEMKANRHYTLELRARAGGPVATDVAVELRRAFGGEGRGQVFHTRATVGSDWTTITGAFHSGSNFGNDLEIVLHLDSLAVGQTFEVESISLQEEPGDDPDWIRQGHRLSLRSAVSGRILLLPYFFPVDRHFNGGPADTFTEEKLQELVEVFSATVVEVSASSPVIVESNTLRTGGYELYLLDSAGQVLESTSFHIAFDRLRYSPDYRVSIVDALGRSYRVDTFESRRERYYIKDGQRNINWNLNDFFRNSNRFPVMAHSFANISSDAYPVQITVEVLEHATLPFFDNAPGMTLPLEDVRVLPSSKNVDAQLLGENTFTFTLDQPEKVMVFPNHDKVMEAIHSRTNEIDGYMFQSFEDETGDVNATGSWGFILDDIGEGFKNPLVILAREPNPIPLEEKTSETTLVVRSGDRPSQDDLDTYDVIWFEGGTHDLSRLGEFPTHRAYIRPGQRWYFEENAFVAAGINASDRSGTIGPDGALSPTASAIIGRGTITGINHFWGAGGYDVNSAIAEVTKIQGMNVTDRAQWGVEGGRLIEDVALLGAWHGNNDGLDGLKDCTVYDVLLISHDDNLKLHDGTVAEKVITYMAGTNGHPLMFKEFHRDFYGTGQLILNETIEMRNITVRDVDILGYWRVVINNQNGWFRLSPGALASIQSFPTVIENVLFSDIRIESPYLYRVFGFYNAYTDEDLLEDYLATTDLENAEKNSVRNLTYLPSWLLQTTGEGLMPEIRNVIFHNISVDAPMISHRSLLGTAFEDTIDGFRFTNITINGEPLTPENFEDHFEVTGYRNGTGLGDEGLRVHLQNANWGSPAAERVEVALPPTLYAVFDTYFDAYFDAWAADRGITGDPDDPGEYGVSLLHELAFGSAPGDRLRISADGGGDMTLRFKSLATPFLPVDYILETSSDLTSGSWDPEELPIQRPNGFEFGEYVNSEINIPMGQASMFYRLRATSRDL